MRSALLVVALAIPATASLAQIAPPPPTKGVVVNLKPVADGVRRARGGSFPIQLKLSDARPPSVSKIPDAAHPQFAALKLGVKGHERDHVVMLDEPTDGSSKLYIDTNADGDLTNDPACEWTHKPYKSPDGKELLQYTGGGMVTLVFGTQTVPAHFSFIRMDPRGGGENRISAYGDYGMHGTVSLDSAPRLAMFFDELSGGDYLSGATRLLIDVNRNGKIDRRGETFDTSRPFNIDNNTYKVTELQSDGTFNIAYSDAVVKAEVICADLSIGDKVGAFDLPALDGTPVKFPDSFKGKLVLFHAWATGARDPEKGMARFAAAAAQLSNKPVALVGIVLDAPSPDPARRDAILATAKAAGMNWPQIWFLDNTGMPELARRLGLDVPWSAVLVDGDSGLVVQDPAALSGDGLVPTTSKASDNKISPSPH